MTVSIEKIKLRAAIGVRSEDFQISPNDFIELLRFSQAGSYEDLCSACDNIAAKYPTRDDYEALLVELEDIGDTPRAPSIEERKHAEWYREELKKEREQESADKLKREQAWQRLKDEASPRLLEYMNARKHDQLDWLAWDTRKGATPPLTEEEIAAIKRYYAAWDKPGCEFLRQKEYR